MMALTTLPHVDAHTIEIAASAADVWDALLATLDGAFSGVGATRYARIIGCAPVRSTGPRPVGLGSTFPGFEVVAFEPTTRLALAGRHRFSSYELDFEIESLDSTRSRLTAVTRAVFPGLAGEVYRTLVIRSGFHVVAVRRLLEAAQRAAQQQFRPGAGIPTAE